MTLHEDIRSIPIVGGWLALDFANTTSERHGGAPHERLVDYPALLVWAGRVSLLSEKDMARLGRMAASHHEAAQQALAALLAFRETIYRAFSALAAGSAPAPADLERLTQARREAAVHHRLAPGGEGYAWTWEGNDGDLAGLLHPVAESAVQLLLSGDLERVKECTGEDCNWLFIDASRNRSRRWCDMRDCGNRAKARRHYARVQGKGRRNED